MPSTDHDALVFLLAAANPPPRWGNGTRRRRVVWDCDEEDLSKWEGVRVNREGRVVSLILPDSGLEGTSAPAPRIHTRLILTTFGALSGSLRDEIVYYCP